MDFIPSMEWSQFHEEFLSEAEQAALKKKAHAEGISERGYRSPLSLVLYYPPPLRFSLSSMVW